MNYSKSLSILTLALTLGSFGSMGSNAAEVLQRREVTQSVVQDGTAGAPKVSAIKIINLKFKGRLLGIDDRISFGLSHSYLTSSQASSFKQEQQRLMDLTAQAQLAGFPRHMIDDLEKQVTALNANVSSAMSNAPVAAVPVKQRIGTKVDSP
jgi:hypothetical protein